MIRFISNSKERSRFLRFISVGLIGAIVDFGLENLLHQIFGVHYVIAGGISFICAILSNFIWNRYWTYPDSRTKTLLRQLGEFFIVSVAGLGIRLPILHFVEPLLTRWINILDLRIMNISPDLLGENITLMIAVTIVMFWNFFINRYWTYGDVK